MRSFRGVLAVVGAVVVVSMTTSPSRGQTQLASTGASRETLMLNEGVQRELKLNASQIAKVVALAERTRAKKDEAMRSVQELPFDESREKFKTLNRVLDKRADEELAAILDSFQVKRFHQIRIQVGGVAGMNQPELQDKLKLTEGQRSAIAKLLEECDIRGAAILKNLRAEQEARANEFIAFNRDVNRRGIALLDPEQKKIWDSLTGLPSSSGRTRGPIAPLRISQAGGNDQRERDKGTSQSSSARQLLWVPEPSANSRGPRILVNSPGHQFSGSINSRGQVRQFSGSRRGAIRSDRGAIGHALRNPGTSPNRRHRQNPCGSSTLTTPRRRRSGSK